MENNQIPYITRCKRLIEDKLAWSIESKNWKQRDYLNLISILENKTGISLSLSTVKRIWSENYSGTPHPATLDTLAKFLDHENWLSFQESQKAELLFPQANQQSSDKSKYKIKKYLLLLSLPVLIIIIASLALSRAVEHKETDLSFAPEQIAFSSSNAQPIGVPNTVIFNYKLQNLKADSFFIQQSWNPFNREKIKRTDTVLTSIYYYPGVHTAKLIANDSVIKETTLRIYSDGWIATVDYGMKDFVPNYIDLDVINRKPKLHITKKQLLDSKLDLNKMINVSYFYVDEFEKISGDHFALTINLKGDSILNFTCPGIRLFVLGTLEMHSFSLIDKGCTNKAYVKFGEMLMNGKNNDLTNLGVNIYDEQQITIHVKEKKARIYLNGQLSVETAYSESIGDIAGFCLSFTGSGQINSLKLSNDIDEASIFDY